jgi:hypothetical protein
MTTMPNTAAPLDFAWATAVVTSLGGEVMGTLSRKQELNKFF